LVFFRRNKARPGKLTVYPGGVRLSVLSPLSERRHLISCPHAGHSNPIKCGLFFNGSPSKNSRLPSEVAASALQNSPDRSRCRQKIFFVKNFFIHKKFFESGFFGSRLITFRQRCENLTFFVDFSLGKTSRI